MQSENMNKRKAIYILLSLLIAFSMWFYVDMFGNNGSYRPTQKTVENIPITYIGADDLAGRGLMMVEEQTSNTLDLTFEGSRVTLANLSREDINIMVNLSDIENSGIRRVDYQITFTDGRFSRDMVKESSIDRATVNVRELYSKTVEVYCELIGNVADGYLAGQMSISHDMLEVRGQPEDIDPVSYVKVTLDIGKDATETVSRDLEIQYFDANDRLLSGENLHPATEAIQATLPVYVTKELPLVVDFKEANGASADNLDYQITPPSIVISGNASTLNELDVITLGEFDLLELEGEKLTSNSYPIILPAGCENLSGVTRATVEISFKDMVNREVPTTLLAYENVPVGKTIEILTREVGVKIFGTAGDVNAVVGNNITVTADLSNYAGALGTYTVPAYIDIITPGDVGVSGTYQVQVIIRNAAENPSAPTEPSEIPEGSETSAPSDEQSSEEQA